MNLRRWWERYPSLLDAELAEFSKRGLEFSVDEGEKASGRVVLHGVFRHGDRAITLAVVYPDTFPFMPPQVYAPDETLKRHQNPFDKNLCVLPYGSEFWRSDDADSPHGRPTAAELISQRLADLLDAVEAGGEVLRAAEVPQGEPFTEYYKAVRIGCILLPQFSRTVGEHGTCELRFRDNARWLLPEDTSPTYGAQGLLSACFDASGELVQEAPSRLLDGFGGVRVRTPWVRLSSPTQAADGTRMLRYLKDHHPDALRGPPVFGQGHMGLHMVGVVVNEEVQQGHFEDGWVFLPFTKRTNLRKQEVEILPAANLLRGYRCGRNVLRDRIPEFRSLGRKTLSLVGLGAVGGGIATEMARSLVGEIRLLDRDYVEPGNAVRWEHGFGYAGMMKADSVAAHLRLNYPHTTVVSSSMPIGQAPLKPEGEAELAALDAWASGADLLIDASAEDNVSYVVSMLGTEFGIPQIYAYSIEGYGGVVARVRPGRTGCFQCLLLAERDGLVPRPRAPANVPRVQPIGCANPTFQAPHIDLAPVQTEAARVALSTLCEGAEGYPAIEGDVFCYQVRDPDDRSLVYPLAWSAASLEPHPECEACRAAHPG